MKKIIFVSEIKDPYTDGSSTQIMTRNILVGLKENGYHIHFIATIDSNCNEERMRGYYLTIVDEITVIHSKMDLTLHRNKYVQLARIIIAFATSFRYRKLIRSLSIEPNTLLLSHSPSVEAIFICKQLRKIFKFYKYIQYWSDPITIAGIYPEEVGIKRYPSYLLEKIYSGIAEEIVYGTEVLCYFQQALLTKYRSSMRYIDVSYCAANVPESCYAHAKPLFGYSGSFYRRIRNILPLYNAFKTIECADLMICGDGDVVLESTNTTTVLNKRIAQNDIGKFEEQFNVFVCLLNSNCIQIPGKIFYQSNLKKIILVILDGKYGDRIRDYLEQFNRFEFCYNNEESIKEAVDRICSGQCKVDLSCIDRLSPKYIAAQLIGMS